MALKRTTTPIASHKRNQPSGSNLGSVCRNLSRAFGVCFGRVNGVSPLAGSRICFDPCGERYQQIREVTASKGPLKERHLPSFLSICVTIHHEQKNNEQTNPGVSTTRQMRLFQYPSRKTLPFDVEVISFASPSW